MSRLLLISSVALTLSAAPVRADMIMGRAQITASTTLPSSGAGFTINQICDGIREVAFNWTDVVATEASPWSQLKALYR